jgi:hypothetical protein
LQSDNGFQSLIDVAGAMGIDRGEDLGVGVKDAFLAFLGHQSRNLLPQFRGRLGGVGQKGFVTVVGQIIALDEITDVDGADPLAGFETGPRIDGGIRGRRQCGGFQSGWRRVHGTQILNGFRRA